MKPPKEITRKQVLGEFRTGEIVAAAKQVIAAKGFAATTMDEIAEAAQIAKGTIYLYFKSKNDLFQAVISSILEKLVVRIQEIKQSAGASPEKVRRVLQVMLETLEAEQAFFRVYVSEFPSLVSRSLDEPSPLLELDQDFVTAIAAILEEGMQARDFIHTDARQLTYILRGMAKAVAIHKLVEKSPASVKEALPLLTNLVLRGLALESATPAPPKERPR